MGKFKLAESPEYVRDHFNNKKVEVRRIVATEDFEVTIFDGKDYKSKTIKEGQVGGLIGKNVTLGDNTWLEEDVIVTGYSTIEGVICGRARIEDSTIGQNTILAGRPVIEDTLIGDGATIYGTTSLKDTIVRDEATIIGSLKLVRCTVDNEVCVNQSGTFKGKYFHSPNSTRPVWLPD